MKQYIYLDDVRTPTQGVGENDQPWVVVRSYDEFVEKVNEILEFYEVSKEKLIDNL